MAEYEIWKFLHICMFVFWLGTDVGVMLCSKKSVDPNLSIETRFQMLEMALKIELLPRVMWVMALPFGVHLSSTLGYINPSVTTMALMWAFTFTWLVINVGGAANLNKPWGQSLSKINRYIVALLGLGLVIVSVSSRQLHLDHIHSRRYQEFLFPYKGRANQHTVFLSVDPLEEGLR